MFVIFVPFNYERSFITFMIHDKMNDNIMIYDELRWFIWMNVMKN